MPETTAVKSAATPNQAKGFSLLTLILIFTVAGIGLSHVQTTYQLQQLEKEHRQLEIAYSRISNYEISTTLANALAEMNIRRIGDLSQVTIDELKHSSDLDKTSLDELQSLLQEIGWQSQ